MFDRNLMKLSGMGAVMGALAVLALLQAAAICTQAYFLSSCVAALWAGDTLDSQVPQLAAFFICFVLQRLIVFAQDTMLDRFSQKSTAALREKLLVGVFDARSMSASKVGSASIAVSATEGIEEIQTYIRIIPPKLIGMAAISVPLLVYAFSTDFVTGVILLVMFPVIIFFMILLGRQARARAERQYGSYRRLSSRFIDTLRGIDVIDSFGAGDAEEKAVWRFSEKLRNATVRTLSTATLSSAVLDLCATFGVAAVAIMLAFRLMDGSMALAPALCALIIAPEYFSPIRSFASDFHASLDGKNALAAVLDMIAISGEAPDCGDGHSVSHETESDPAYPADSAYAIRFDSVTYAYENAVRNALDSVTFDIAPGEHVAIVGPSGAGKSTLTSIAAGFLKPTSGAVAVADSGSEISSPDRADELREENSRLIRYIPQNPYVFRMSLMDNVRFYAPSATREQVLHACEIVGLDELVDELPDGLDTAIGEGARGLSGGQAHRVALARVLLDENAHILIFDEPTAHLDIETELELKERMLAIMGGRTVIFATHRLHWVADMDRVITIEDGRVVSDEPVRRECDNEDASIAPPVALSTESVAAGNVKASPRIESAATKEANDAALTDAIAPSPVESAPEESTQRTATESWLRSWLGKYRRHVIVAIAFGFVSAGFAGLLMFTSGLLISMTACPGVTLFSILLPVAFVQIFGLGKPVARYIERLVSHDWVFKITSDLRVALYRTIRVRSGDPIRARATGEYLSVLDDDIAHLQNLYLRVTFPAAIAYLLVIGTAIVFGAFSLPAALVMFALLLALGLAIPLLAARIANRRSIEAKRVKAAEYTTLTDDVLGATDWVLARRTRGIVSSHAQAFSKLVSTEAQIRMIERVSSLVMTIAFGAIACCVAAWAAQRFGGTAGSGNWIAAFVLGFFPLIDPFSALPSAFVSSAEHREALARLEEHASAAPAIALAEASIGESASGIAFDNVTYAYPGAPHYALDGVTLDIPTGQSVAILGKSGSGKTTLVNLARGKLKPIRGSVSICGATVKAHETDVSSLIGYLGQRPYLFERTLRENLALGNDKASDENLIAALESVGLGGKLSSLPEGLDTIIGETGVGFSGGEAHRVALARVLVADTPIILVDEPFAALDPETEAMLIDTLFEVAEGRTLIVITHHLAQIERFDRVVFVEDGSVNLDGSPDDLKRENRRFRQLLSSDRAQ